jgi:hypothetical protein
MLLGGVPNTILLEPMLLGEPLEVVPRVCAIVCLTMVRAKRKTLQLIENLLVFAPIKISPCTATSERHDSR